MNQKIRIGICGYGNLGKGVESEIVKNPDMELIAVFTRRDPAEASRLKKHTKAPFIKTEEAPGWKDKIDVMILCGGSKSDLEEQGPEFAKNFNTVDSFDTHAKIPGYFESMNNAALAENKISIISAGWDPGLFSLLRLYTGAVIPVGETYTFWGPGVSQGHSDAIRRIKGVQGAIQYTIPNEEVIERIKNGETPNLSAREKHKRVCYVACEEEAEEDQTEKDRIEKEIKNMPDYFADYDTTVYFVSQEELQKNHSKMKHGGNVVHTGETGETSEGNKQIIEFSLKLDSNPEFTSSILIAFARAAHRLAEKGENGARTIFDIPPALLSPVSPEDQRKTLL